MQYSLQIVRFHLYIIFIIYYLLCFFFFKQKTAYEMRISDWSSDVCSSDLLNASITTRVRFTPAHDGDRAGLAAFQNDDYWFFLGIEQEIGRASCRERVCQ